jgi:hypothetical protein
MLWRNDGSIAAMSYWCPRCERFAPTATCPGCGTQIVEYWAARVRWCLIAASVADALGTLAAWGQFGGVERSRVLTREAINGMRTGLVVAACLVAVLIVMAVGARRRPALAAYITVAAIPIAAVLALACAPRWLWASFLSGAPIGWGLALVAAGVACVWARRARQEET